MPTDTHKKKTRGRRRPTDPNSRLVPAREAEKESGIPYTTLRDAAHRGQIDPVVIGRSWYFERKDLARMIAAAKKPVGEDL